MQTVAGARILPIAQRGFREDFKGIIRAALPTINQIIISAAGADGIISEGREANATSAAGEAVLRLFVGSDGRRAFDADGVTPLAPYPRLINKWVSYVTVKAVTNHQKWMARHVPEDVYRWLAAAKVPEALAETVSVTARMMPGFVPNALAAYDPLHQWVDPNGYRLSDRVWRTGFDTRQRLDAMLAEQIRNGNSAFNISRKSEQFLLPGRAALRTDKPYGKDASYRGMVLGRTEITRAHGEATLIAARLNPYVQGMDWALSASHPKLDICDMHATIGMGGGRLKDPYDLYSVPPYPPHPQCLCTIFGVVTESPAAVTENLRAYMMGDIAEGDNGVYVQGSSQRLPSPPLTPAASDSLLWLLLGAGLYRWWQANQGEVAA